MSDQDEPKDELRRLRARVAELEDEAGPEERPVDRPPPNGSRRVSPLLAIGIFLLPFLFVWLLLRRGHSPLARTVGFAWLMLWLAVVIFGRGAGPTNVASSPADQLAATPMAEFVAKDREMLQAELLCEADGATAVLASASGDAVSGYRAANEGQTTCFSAAAKLREIRFEKPIPDDVRGRLNAATAKCAEALEYKATALRLAAKVFNGDQRPSEILAAQDADRFAREKQANCDKDYSEAAASGGFPKPGSEGFTGDPGKPAVETQATPPSPPDGNAAAQQVASEPVLPNPYPPADTPPDVRALLSNEDREDEACRGGSGDDPATMAACKRRDAYVAQLEAHGWCYGEGASDGAHSFWAKCRGRPAQ